MNNELQPKQAIWGKKKSEFNYQDILFGSTVLTLVEKNDKWGYFTYDDTKSISLALEDVVWLKECYYSQIYKINGNKSFDWLDDTLESIMKQSACDLTLPEMYKAEIYKVLLREDTFQIIKKTMFKTIRKEQL